MWCHCFRFVIFQMAQTVVQRDFLYRRISAVIFQTIEPCNKDTNFRSRDQCVAVKHSEVFILMIYNQITPQTNLSSVSSWPTWTRLVYSNQ